MRLRPRAVAAAALCAACSSPPPAPAVAISAPPPPPPATAEAKAAAPSASADAEPEPAPPSCDDLMSEAMQRPHTTVEDCDEKTLAISQVLAQCDPDRDRHTWSALQAADCRQDVLDAAFEKLKATLPAADQARQAAAHETYRTNIHAYCVRDRCDIAFTSGCTTGVLHGGFTIVDAARQGALQLDKTGTPGKETVTVFSEYAKAICSLPKSAWKDGKAPAGCVNRVLATLEDSVGQPGRCAGP